MLLQAAESIIITSKAMHRLFLPLLQAILLSILLMTLSIILTKTRPGRFLKENGTDIPQKHGLPEDRIFSRWDIAEVKATEQTLSGNLATKVFSQFPEAEKWQITVIQTVMALLRLGDSIKASSKNL